jgi:hypothetical protein
VVIIWTWISETQLSFGGFLRFTRFLKPVFPPCLYIGEINFTAFEILKSIPIENLIAPIVVEIKKLSVLESFFIETESGKMLR